MRSGKRKVRNSKTWKEILKQRRNQGGKRRGGLFPGVGHLAGGSLEVNE